MLTAAEVLWLSGLALGLIGGLPLGIIVDRLLLRPSVRFLAHRTEHDRRP